MGLFFWKKNKVIDEFATKVADEFYSRVLPNHAVKYFDGKTDKKKSKEIESLLNTLVRDVNQFRDQESLGIYGKARLHLTFMERLKELGYNETTSKEINKVVMVVSPLID